MKVRVLVVEHDDQIRNRVVNSLQEKNAGSYELESVSSSEEAIACAALLKFDVAIINLCQPGIPGLDLISHLQRLCPNISVIVASPNRTIEVAVEALKHGASDFLFKPPFDLRELEEILAKTVSKISSKHQAASSEAPRHQLVAISPGMLELLNQVSTVAPFNTTVLITGATGTGKELIAQTIHRQSQRAKRPFVALNCAAVPEQLLEDELFGHIKGAYTGALTVREGRFEQANGGTLFLDEIGDLSLPLQAKLLRVLQEREFEKLGSSKTTKVDVRIIAATNVNLEQRVADGSFRADLYYRLNVVRLTIPLLKDRPEDIPLLANYFLSHFCTSFGLPAKEFDAAALNAMKNYSWPGNVRQLGNTVERSAALSGTSRVVGIKDLPEEFHTDPIPTPTVSPATLIQNTPILEQIPEQGIHFDAFVTQIERELLCRSLEKTGGNKMQAAKLLKMKRTTFVEKLKRLGISDDFPETKLIFST